MRPSILLAILLLASCSAPPPEAYYGSATTATGVALGTNAAGESCTLQPRSAGGDVFCATWQQPSGEVARGGAATAADPVGHATGGIWRSAIDLRLVCGPPQTTTILGGAPAVLMQCTRQIGGWPQVALVAAVNGSVWQADSILPASPVLERTIGIMAGTITAQAAPTMAPGAAAGLIAARVAAQAFSAGDVGRYDALMTAGTRANLAQSFPQAEQAFRAALAVQRKARGADDGAGAIGFCRQALALLRRIQSGVAPGLIEPCLGIYAVQAEKAPPAERQSLLAEMFETAQLAQGGVTRRQIAEAAARLAENAKDPRVGAAILRRQDAGERLSGLVAERDTMAARARGELAGDVAPLPSAADLDKQIGDARAELADADAAMQGAAPNYGQLVQQVVPAAAVLKALGPREAFFGITLTGGESWSFLLRNGEIRVTRSATGLGGMEALVRRLRAGIEPGDRGLPRFDVAAARQLYADTLGAFDAELEDTSARVVAPSGPLLAVPFAVLLMGPADAGDLAVAPWLVRRMAITHVAPAANFVALRAVAGGSRATRPWFGAGDFRPVSLAQAQASFLGGACADSARLFAGLPPLSFASRELALARGTLGGSPGDELLGSAFTVPAVKAADLSRYRVLHFAAHALLPTDLKCEREPALVTSSPPGAKDAAGALLTASRVSGLKLDADAVILSACNSAGPGGTAGESLSGLARALFYAGARTLLVTHWSVSDQAAAFLVVQTLEGYRASKPIVRQAEPAMIERAGGTGCRRSSADLRAADAQ